jgi:hypothetical protein
VSGCGKATFAVRLIQNTLRLSEATRAAPFWETGTGLKAHHRFILPLSKARHLEYDADHDAFEAKYGTHAELLLTFWKSIGFEPGEFMTVGRTLRRAAWLERVLAKLMH